jgi:membrane associated rhomboid family serine protease
MFVTYIILGVTIAVSFYAWQKPGILYGFMFNPYAVYKRNEFYRFITSGFIHQDHVHLIFNMLGLYFFGLVVEKKFAEIFGRTGSLYFIVFYLLAIVVSELPTYLKHKGNVNYNSLGASGGVAAIIFGSILFDPLRTISIYFIIDLPGFILGILYVIYSWYQGKRANDNINHDAHLYGAFFGLLFCIVMYPQSLPEFFVQVRHWKFF